MMDQVCPSDKGIERYLQGHDFPERSKLERHLAHCFDCTERLVALKKRADSFESVPVETVQAIIEMGSSAKKTNGPAPWTLLAAAAVVIALLGSGLWMFVPDFLDSREPSIVRNPETPTGERGARLLTPDHQAEVGSTVEFRWERVEQAVGYRLLIVDDVAEILFQGSSGDSRLRVDLAAQGLQPGVYYSWQVIALLPDEVERASQFRSLRYQK